MAMTRARRPARDRLPREHRARRRADRLAVRRGGARGGRRRVGGAATRSSSGPPRRCSRPSGCCATSCSTTVSQVGGRLGELRFDTDLDVSHAVVRYLELIKLRGAAGADAAAAPVASPRRCPRSTRGCCRPRPPSSARSSRPPRSTSTCSTPSATRSCARRGRRARAPSRRSSRSSRAAATGWCSRRADIETYRTCPLKYKFARVFRIPQRADDQPALRHPRPPGARALPRRRRRRRARCPSCSGCSRRAGAAAASATPRRSASCARKATQALIRYHERFQGEDGRAGVVRARRSRSSSGRTCCAAASIASTGCPTARYELIDYKTGRPKTAAQLREDVQLSLYAVGAREAWQLEAAQQAYYYVLDDEKVPVRAHGRRPRLDHARPCSRSPTGSSARASSRPRRARRARCATTGSPARRRRSRRDGALTWPRVPAPALQARGRVVRAALAQEALELAGEHVARGQLGRVGARLLLVGGALEPLDERLHVRVHLDGARDLALVVGGGRLELGARRRSRRRALSSLRSSASARLRVRRRRRRSAARRPTATRTASRRRAQAACRHADDARSGPRSSRR